MHYPREFFAVQLEFVQKMTELAQRPYLDAVLRNTAFYRILGLDWSLDASNPVWQAYCEGLRHEEGDVEWTYQFYLAHLDDIPEYDTSVHHWGCFAHEYHAEEQITALFRERLSQLHDVAEYPHCFPCQAMLTQAPIELF